MFSNMKTSPSGQNQPPSAGQAAERPSAYDGSLPVIPLGFYQISGAGYLQPGDLNWSDYKQEWREYYRAGYCIGNTSVLCRPSDATKAAIAGISAAHEARIAVLEGALGKIETTLLQSVKGPRPNMLEQEVAAIARAALVVNSGPLNNGLRDEATMAHAAAILKEVEGA